MDELLQDRKYLRNPLRAHWYATNACNMRCPHCYTNATRMKDDELKTDEALSMIDQLKELGVLILVISGGEPLLRDDIFDVIAYGSNKGLCIQLATNGLVVSNQVAAKLKISGIADVGVTLEGSTPQIHGKVRLSEGSYYDALAGANNIVAQGIPLTINCTVNRFNAHDIATVCQLAHTIGASHVSLLPIHRVGRGTAADYEIEPSRYMKVVKEIAQLKQKYAQKMTIVLTDPLGAPFTGDQYNAPIFQSCPAAKSQFSIFADGQVSPCGYIPYTAGNIRDSSLENLWHNSELFRWFRETKINEECYDCDFYEKCLGGCRARILSHGRDLSERDPWCLRDKSDSKLD